ncbi:MAG: hypothetical protein ACK55Z_04135, partial [bacterium]
MEDRTGADDNEDVMFGEIKALEDSTVSEHALGDNDLELRRDLDRIIASGSATSDEYLEPDLIGSEKSDGELAILRCYHFE